MAIIKAFNEIEHLIPDADNMFYMGKLAYVPDKVINDNTVYAVTIDEGKRTITNIYRVVFVLFSSEKNHYLFISNMAREVNTSVNFMCVKTPLGVAPEKKDWKFETDEIGLYAVAGIRHKEKIYFTTDHSDVETIRKSLGCKISKEVVTTEKVYV